MAHTEHAGTATDLEQRLAQIWRDVLGIDDVGMNDNFFDLDGSDSLSAMLVFTKMNEGLQIALPPRALFAAPTIAKLATLIRRDFHQGQALRVPPIQRRTSAVALQQAAWFEMERRGPVDFVPAEGVHDGSHAGILHGLIRIHGPVDCTLLRFAFEEVVRRHETLRARFLAVDGEMRQTISVVPRLDLYTLSVADTPKDVRAAVTKVLLKAPDYSSGCLLRVTLLSLAPGKHLVVPVLARVAGDDWTMHLVIREAMTLYGAQANGRPYLLAEPPLQYTDYIEWQRQWLSGPAREDIQRYFDTSLRGVPGLKLPYDHPVSPNRRSIGGRAEFCLPERLALAVYDLASRESTSPYYVMLTAFLALLRDWTGQEHIAVTTYFSGRQLPEMHGLAGFLACEALIGIQAGEAASFGELLRQVKETMRRAEEFEGVPLAEFQRLAAAAGQPLPEFPVSVHGPSLAASTALPEYPEMDYDAAPGLVPDASIALPVARNDIEFKVQAGARESLGGVFLYASDAFRGETVEMLRDKLLGILEAGVSDPEGRLNAAARGEPAATSAGGRNGKLL